MNLLQTLIILAVAGLLVGGVARIFLPGREAIGVFGTILAGLAGSFIGGLIARYLLGTNNGWIVFALAVGAAILFILPFRMYVAQTVVVPGTPVRRGIFGARTVDPAYDPAYSDGYARRSFWGRRRRPLW
jgi:uncharacterized membrane protein YeaQ/YmgE (transglycosylase-associated protein family)